MTQSVAELEVHSRIFDEMGFLPATPYNKINIHVGGMYGDKEAALERFSKVRHINAVVRHINAVVRHINAVMRNITLAVAALNSRCTWQPPHWDAYLDVGVVGSASSACGAHAA